MIAQRLESEPARVFTEHLPEYDRTVAHFVWPEGKPDGCFDIAVSDMLSIRFDAHLPVRPDTITLLGDRQDLEEGALEQLAGIAVAQAIVSAKHAGFGTLETALTTENRLALAQLQANSPTSPPLIKALSRAIASQDPNTHSQFVPHSIGSHGEYSPIQG